MVKLSGILEYSMGGFLCLRGYTSFKELSRVSKENPSVQRKLIEEHKGEMADFLNKGEYRFFPEVVLSASLETSNNFEEVNYFFNAMQRNEPWRNAKLGVFQLSVFYHDSGDRNKIVHITFDEKAVVLNRIDGNHRLSAANEVLTDFKVPFCLVLCQTREQEKQYSTAIFHNINAKQIPLRLEENLKVILESDDVFSDTALRDDRTFGWEYYLSRKVLKMDILEKYPFVDSLIRGWECTYLWETFRELLKCGHLKKDPKLQ